MSKYKITSKELDNLNDEGITFGTTKLLPAISQIPQEFKDGHTKWNKLFNDWFFNGLSELTVIPKENIDKSKALAVISAHMKSWEPKHEHKEAGIAYMMSLLFEDAKWKIND